MDTSYNIGNEMDANMFNQYMYNKRPDENLDVSLSVPQYNGHPPPPSHLRYHNLNDQTFHTPSFGDEEFDIPIMHHQPPPQHHQLEQYHQMHSQMALMNDQAYNQHQWHQQAAAAAESHMMGNQTYQLHSPNHSNYHHMSSPNQMLMMQPPAPAQHQQAAPQNQHPQQIQPQMSPQLGGNNYIGQSPPQTAPISNENGSTSDDSDDNALNDPNANNTFKRPSPDPYIGNDSPNRNSSTMKSKPAPVRKPKASKKKKKKDPNEPQKPVSAYALFFRDTQASIKGQNPNASFGEVSKIVASMWDVLAPDHKNVYKKRTEVAKKEYLKALAAYRASLVSQGTESESQSPPHQQPKAPTVQQTQPHKIQNQPTQHSMQQPNARMSPHQMPPNYVQQMPPHNYQPGPPYTPPYGSPQQPLIYQMNPNMMQPPPHNGMMNMQQQQQQQQPPPPQYINQQGYIEQQQQQQQQQQQPPSAAQQQQSEMLVFS